MASPPRSSPTSPPYPQNVALPNPKKRPSIHLATSQHPAKRRKPGSIASGASSAHPLRQTSFPPEEAVHDLALRSPSVDSDVTGYTGDGTRSAVTGGSVKWRKRKGKRRKRDTNESIVGKSRTAAEGGIAADVDDEEEDEDEDIEGLVDDDDETADQLAEKGNKAILIDAFNKDQELRYEAFTRFKLRKETVRKITNFTLAQSVPQAVITTINGYTKMFIGTLIEKARDVQQEWASLQTPPDTPQRNAELAGRTADPLTRGTVNGEEQMKMIDPDALLNGTPTSPQKASKERNLGPLLPDHFREALRRYKRDGEAQATGLTGFSVGLGVPGTGSARLQGRRLFR